MSSHGTQTVDSRLGRIIKEYLEAVKHGEDPSADKWVQRHPDFAEPLREFFAGRQQLNQLLSEAQRPPSMRRRSRRRPAGYSRPIHSGSKSSVTSATTNWNAKSLVAAWAWCIGRGRSV